MKKTKKQTDEETAAINALKDMILAALTETGNRERVLAMPEEVTKQIYTQEQIEQIKKDADKAVTDMWQKFYHTFYELGHEI